MCFALVGFFFVFVLLAPCTDSEACSQFISIPGNRRGMSAYRRLPEVSTDTLHWLVPSHMAEKGNLREVAHLHIQGAKDYFGHQR